MNSLYMSCGVSLPKNPVVFHESCRPARWRLATAMSVVLSSIAPTHNAERTGTAPSQSSKLLAAAAAAAAVAVAVAVGVAVGVGVAVAVAVAVTVVVSVPDDLLVPAEEAAVASAATAATATVVTVVTIAAAAAAAAGCVSVTCKLFPADAAVVAAAVAADGLRVAAHAQTATNDFVSGLP